MLKLLHQLILPTYLPLLRAYLPLYLLPTWYFPDPIAPHAQFLQSNERHRCCHLLPDSCSLLVAQPRLAHRRPQSHRQLCLPMLRFAAQDWCECELISISRSVLSWVDPTGSLALARVVVVCRVVMRTNTERSHSTHIRRPVCL